MKAYRAWKAEMLTLQATNVAANDAVMALNFDKADQKNYLGGATFLEVLKAWELGKKIFLFNPLPESIVRDELAAMAPEVIEGDLSRVRDITPWWGMALRGCTYCAPISLGPTAR